MSHLTEEDRRALIDAMDAVVSAGWIGRVDLLESTIERIVSAKVKEFSDAAYGFAREIAEIRGSLDRVAVYEGLVGVSPVAMLVADLVRDHEELEARIDSALSLLSSVEAVREHSAIEVEVARLLKGGSRVPDTPEGL